jgi:hypothetical protein
MSSDITPPSGLADLARQTPRGSKVSVMEGDGVKRSVADVPGGAWVSTMEVLDSLGRSKIVMRYSLVLANIVAPPLDEVFHTTVSNTTVEDHLYFELLFTVDEDQGEYEIERAHGEGRQEPVVGNDEEKNMK